VGIAPQYHSLIFEPFKRLHGADRPGSGIGLAFCRKFIERDGGKIWVESEEGKGATFRFTLPAVENQSSAFST
jgi:signal transduction histidine kinase